MWLRRANRRKRNRETGCDLENMLDHMRSREVENQQSNAEAMDKLQSQRKLMMKGSIDRSNLHKLRVLDRAILKLQKAIHATPTSTQVNSILIEEKKKSAEMMQQKPAKKKAKKMLSSCRGNPPVRIRTADVDPALSSSKQIVLMQPAQQAYAASFFESGEDNGVTALLHHHRSTTSSTSTSSTTISKHAHDGVVSRFFPKHSIPVFIDADKCPQCGERMRVCEREGILVCSRSDCALTAPHLNTTSSALSYGEDIDISRHVYVRQKHFRSWIQQFHEDAELTPDHVLLDLQLKLQNVHVKSKSEIKPTPVKKILIANGHRKYINQATCITLRLNGSPIPAFTSEEIEKFVQMFVQTQIPFLQLKEPRRINFLNNSYVLAKCCAILGKRHFQQCFVLLKARTVLNRQDATWQRICDYLGWPFERSH